jgi:hypothetical protein
MVQLGADISIGKSKKVINQSKTNEDHHFLLICLCPRDLLNLRIYLSNKYKTYKIRHPLSLVLRHISCKSINSIRDRVHPWLLDSQAPQLIDIFLRRIFWPLYRKRRSLFRHNLCLLEIVCFNRFPTTLIYTNHRRKINLNPKQ